MNIASLLSPEAVLPHFSARDKKQALKQLAAHAAMLTSLSEREIYSILSEREYMGCTAMGNGVCIPHGRFNDLEKPYAIFARLDKSVDFEARDGKPVDLIFLLLTPASANTEHLKALAMISRLLRDKDLCEALRNTGDEAALYSLLQVHDAAA